MSEQLEEAERVIAGLRAQLAAKDAALGGQMVIPPQTAMSSTTIEGMSFIVRNDRSTPLTFSFRVEWAPEPPVVETASDVLDDDEDDSDWSEWDSWS